MSRARRVPARERHTLSVAEACRHSGLSRSTIYRLIEDGHVASSRVLGRRLIDRASLERMLRDGVSSSAPKWDGNRDEDRRPLATR